MCALTLTTTTTFADTTSRGDPANAASVNNTGAAACGDVQIHADTSCRLETSGGCTAKCSQGARFAVACEARCAGKCSESPDDGCRTDCATSCESDCAATPVDCSADCTARCSGDCTAYCKEGDEDCTKKCAGSCDAQCTAKCEKVPSTECKDVCASSCEAVCAAKANRDCDISCDSTCHVDLKGSCEANCTDARAALFCDGQFVSADDVKACVTHLTASGVASIPKVSLTCSGNSCTGTVDGHSETVTTKSCTVARVGSGNSDGRDSYGAIAVLGVALGFGLRRRAERGQS